MGAKHISIYFVTFFSVCVAVCSVFMSCFCCSRVRAMYVAFVTLEV